MMSRLPRPPKRSRPATTPASGRSPSAPTPRAPRIVDAEVNLRFRCALGVGLAALGIVLTEAVLVAAGKPSHRSEVEIVDAYLEGLGLFDLQSDYLERELRRPASTTSRATLGKRLAEVYANRLLSVTEQRAIDDLNRR